MVSEQPNLVLDGRLDCECWLGYWLRAKDGRGLSYNEPNVRILSTTFFKVDGL